MNIITKNEEIVNTFIVFHAKSDITSHFGNELPYPNKHYALNNGMKYIYLLEGYFDTQKNIDYLNDIIARINISFNNNLSYQKHYKTSYNTNPHKLKEFQELKSLANTILAKSIKFDGTRDYVFMNLKMYAEFCIKERGIVVYDDLLKYGQIHFIDDVKDYSTLKAKCRSITNWYIDRDYKLSLYYERKTKNDEELEMTRKENALKMGRTKEEEMRKKIQHFLTGMFIDDYKHKRSGKWNSAKIAKDMGISRTTVNKHLKEMEEK
jgi:hypothetical protein